MLQIYYTISSGLGDVQKQPSLSLGGYKSSTIVKNAEYNNIFGEISIYTMLKNLKEYIGLILVNEGDVGASNIRLHFVYPEGCQTLWKVAATDMSQDVEGVELIERVATRTTKPFYATFYEADGEENAVDLGSLESGQSMGIWFERSLAVTDSGITQAEYDFNVENRLTKVGNRYVETPLDKLDTVTINIVWDDNAYSGGDIGGNLI